MKSHLAALARLVEAGAQETGDLRDQHLRDGAAPEGFADLRPLLQGFERKAEFGRKKGIRKQNPSKNTYLNVR